MKQAETSRKDGHLAIGGLADGGLADGWGIQHDTLSRWRSGVRIPSGSPTFFPTLKNIPHIGQIAKPSNTKRQWPKRRCRPFHIPARPENRIGRNADVRLPLAKHPSLFRHFARLELPVTFLLVSAGRYHENGTGTPRVYRQPYCGQS